MNLTLEVISSNGSSLGAARSKVFGSSGGKIGRADCDWVLPSPERFVSRHHASILFANGTFYIKVEGNNEVAINDPNVDLACGKPTPIRHRDRIFLGEYEILANLISEAAQSTPLIGDPFGDDESEPFGASQIMPPVEQSDLLDQLPQVPKRSGAHPGNFKGIPQGDVMNEPMIFESKREKAPLVTQESRSVQPIPSDPLAWDKTLIASRQAQRVDQTPIGRSPAQRETGYPPADIPRPREPKPGNQSAAAAPGSGDSFDLANVLRAAGVDPQSVDPETAATLGHIFKMVIQGTIEALRARDEVKSQFRLAVTRVKTTENNPLAFSVDAADALNAMFVRRNPAFLAPLEAFQRAFDDIRAHQVSMIAGMRAGFENLMNRFDPEELQARFDKQAKRGGLLGVVSKPNYWELYQVYFGELRGDRDDAFRQLFGDEFALAYEKQIELLKRGRKSQ